MQLANLKCVGLLNLAKHSAFEDLGLRSKGLWSFSELSSTRLEVLACCDMPVSDSLTFSSTVVLAVVLLFIFCLRWLLFYMLDRRTFF